jgi:hypothetical protein
MLVALGFAPTFVAMEMLLYDLTSVIVGSAILAGLFVSIAIRRPKTIIALNNNWQKIEVRA